MIVIGLWFERTSHVTDETVCVFKTCPVHGTLCKAKLLEKVTLCLTKKFRVPTGGEFEQ